MGVDTANILILKLFTLNFEGLYRYRLRKF